MFRANPTQPVTGAPCARIRERVPSAVPQPGLILNSNQFRRVGQGVKLAPPGDEYSTTICLQLEEVIRKNANSHENANPPVLHKFR